VSRPFPVHLPLEEGRWRRVLFAVEVLDGVTLERLSEGLEVEADGLRGKPRRNVAGAFVWLDEDLTPLRKVTVDPQRLPYEPVELLPGELRLPPAATVVQLPPRADYPFAAGTTGLRGSLVESRTTPPPPPTPLAGAAARLQWLDDDGVNWREAATAARTSPRGDFVAILRLAAGEVPKLDPAGALTVRLRVGRGGVERTSTPLQLPSGRVADPATFPHGASALTFAWDELQP
jgi:hypothetical protein